MAGQIGHGIMEEEVWRKGPWTAEEDRLLIDYVRLHGEGRWNSVARLTGNYKPIFFYSCLVIATKVLNCSCRNYSRYSLLSISC